MLPLLRFLEVTVLVAHPSQPSLTPVVTVLLPTERSRVDAAGDGLYRTIHRDSIEDVIRDLKEQRAWVVLLSTTRCSDGSAGRVARLVREFPPPFARIREERSDAAFNVDP